MNFSQNQSAQVPEIVKPTKIQNPKDFSSNNLEADQVLSSFIDSNQNKTVSNASIETLPQNMLVSLGNSVNNLGKWNGTDTSVQNFPAQLVYSKQQPQTQPSQQQQTNNFEDLFPSTDPLFSSGSLDFSNPFSTNLALTNLATASISSLANSDPNTTTTTNPSIINNNSKSKSNLQDTSVHHINSSPNNNPSSSLSPNNQMDQNLDETDVKRERNRLAAEKYRKKNRDLIAKLSDECQKLEGENSSLLDANRKLEDQVRKLKEMIAESVKAGHNFSGDDWSVIMSAGLSSAAAAVHHHHRGASPLGYSNSSPSSSSSSLNAHSGSRASYKSKNAREDDEPEKKKKKKTGKKD